MAPIPLPLDPLPTTFGKYQILERIAVGSMAEIYKARIEGMGGFHRAFAIKRVLPHLADRAGMSFEEYLRHVEFLAEHWLDWENLGPLVDSYALVIGEAVADDVQGPGAEVWREALAGETNSLRSFAAERRKFLLEHESITSLEE